MTITPTRQPQGIPAGGQFAGTSHAEPGFGLNASAPAVSVPLQGGRVDLHESSFGSLPELPASVGHPEVTFDFNDDGKLETHVTVGGSTMSFWFDEMADEITNSVEAGSSEDGEDAPWSNIAEYSDWEQTRTWAEAVHERVDGATYRVLNTAVDNGPTRDSIVDFATGRLNDRSEPTPEESSNKRAAAALAVVEDGESDQITMRDLLTDLRHFAFSRGIDMDQVLDDSREIYRDETLDDDFRNGGR